MRLCIADIVSATGGKLICGNLNAEIKSVLTDSRKISPGDFFIALKGERFDGHDFIIKAWEEGASGCLMERNITDEEFERIDSVNFAIIRVDDTLKGLAQIAAAYRRMFEGRVCAVTGSVGKTSTKDMIASVLAREFSVQKTFENFNNEIGLPLTILGLKKEHTALVAEMGMRGFGEIDYLAEILKPDVGVITNIGVSHIEKLGSQENIFKAKMEMAKHIKQGGTLVLNGDDKFLGPIDKYENINIMKFGIENEEADVWAGSVKIKEDGTGVEFELHIKNIPCEIYMVKINVPGVHNIYNALCAACVGLSFNMNISDIIDGIGEYEPSGMRQNITLAEGGFKIINDAYNASPDSMKASIEMLDSLPCEGKKIAVLGDMFELGENSAEYHAGMGRIFSKTNADILVTVGELAKNIASAAEGKSSVSFDEKEEAIKYLEDILAPGDILLIKASRGMRLEEIAEELLKRREKQ